MLDFDNLGPARRASRRDSTSLDRKTTAARTSAEGDGAVAAPTEAEQPSVAGGRRDGRRGSNSVGRNVLVADDDDGVHDDVENNHGGVGAVLVMETAERHRNEKTLSSPDSVTRLTCRSAFYKQFELGSQIGQGNFSDVYLVFGVERGQKYALKEIDKARMRGKLHFVENEVALLRRCLHRNICRLVDAFECQRHYYLLFDYAQKGDLFDTIRRVGRLSERSCAQITRQIASALAFLHRRRIVHRDVKPENILLSADSTVKLADFGLACIVLGPLYRVCGTPTYVAPEILTQQGYGVEVDVWSLGIILHICLAGFAPFRCADRVQLFRQIVRSRLTFDHPNWACISFKAKKLLLGMLVPEPARRWDAEQVLRNEWVTTHNTTMVEKEGSL